jgi:microcystin degradation protein MlrC
MQHYRIAYLGIRHESNTFLPSLTTYSDFNIVRKAPSKGVGLDALRTALNDLPGTLTVPDELDLAALYLAGATPSGVVSHDAYYRLKAELLQTLQAAMPVDGVLLDLHGAMEVDGLDKPEPDLAAAVRDIVGPDIPISVSLDLHGNLTQALLDQVNCITAFRTAPHRDYPDTVSRALRHLLRCMRDGLRPRMALVRVPLLMPGEFTMTTAEPARGLYAQIRHIEQAAGVLDASLMIGYAWADRIHTAMNTLVVAESDQALAYRLAQDFARDVWARRDAFAFPGESAGVEEAIRRAMASTQRPVFLSDSGDNVTAGAAGDKTMVLEALIAQGAQDALVAGIEDAEAFAVCNSAGAGATVELALGNRFCTSDAVPFRAFATVEQCDQHPNCVRVKIGGVRVLITQRRQVFGSRADIATASGMDPMQQQIVVVKLGYLMPDLYDHAPRSILVLSSGFTDLDMLRFGFRQAMRPIFPLDTAFDFA